MRRFRRSTWVHLVIAVLVVMLFAPDTIWGRGAGPRAYGPVSVTGPLAATAATGDLAAAFAVGQFLNVALIFSGLGLITVPLVWGWGIWDAVARSRWSRAGA